MYKYKTRNIFTHNTDFKKEKNKDLLEKEKWQKLIFILKSLDDDFSYFKRSRENQDYIWEYVIQLQKKFRNKIRKVIRKNTKLCYELDQNHIIRDINEPFFRVNHLFDKDFYNKKYNSFQGLYNFIKIIKTSFGNINKFLTEIKAIKNTFEFFDNNYNTLLIKNYEYLIAIDLPVKGYENLKFKLITILKKMEQLFSIISNPVVFNKFLTDLQKFKNSYIINYQRKHDIYQEKLKKFYKELHSLPEFQTLKYISKNKKSIKLIRHINHFFPDLCKNDNIKTLLAEKPQCECGFVIGDSVPSIDKLKPKIIQKVNNLDFNINKL